MRSDSDSKQMGQLTSSSAVEGKVLPPRVGLASMVMP